MSDSVFFPMPACPMWIKVTRRKGGNSSEGSHHRFSSPAGRWPGAAWLFGPTPVSTSYLASPPFSGPWGPFPAGGSGPRRSRVARLQGVPVDEFLRRQRLGRPRRTAAATIGVPHQPTSSPPPRSIAGGRKSNVIRTDRPKRRRPLREHLSVELRMSRFPRGPSTDDGRRHRRRDDFI